MSFSEGITTPEGKAVSSVRPKRYNKRLKLTPHPSQSTSANSNIDLDISISNDDSEVNQLSNEQIPPESACREENGDINIVNDNNYLFEEDISPSPKKDASDFEETMQQLLANIWVNRDHIQDEEQDFEPEEEITSDQDENDSDKELDYNETEDCSKNKDAASEDQPIYQGHTMTISVSLLLILMYTVTHGISGSQLNDLLTLIGLHCLEVHPGLKSLFHFKQYFAGLKSPLVKHFYCVYCLTCVNEHDEICTNRFCGKNLKGAKSKSYFIEVSIDEQLGNFFKRPNFTELLKQRFKRTKTSANNIEDIYDGEVYKCLSKDGGVLSDRFPYNISFTLNTDGVPLFKSSKFSIWPVYLMINELPFKQRKQSENMIFCGLWFGDAKPFMGTFFRPIHSRLKKLEEEGITVTVDNENVNCKAFLICITADLPAKSTLMNMIQFNGAFSCSKCYEKGETFKTSGGGSVHIYPFNREMPFGHERTTRTSLHDAMEAVNSKKTVNGIKGPSFLMTLEYFDFIKGASIDYMHGVLLGVTKLLIKLWFSPALSREDFSISHSSDIIDKCLLQIKPPSFVTRIPRSISTHFKYWKASELRSWLFFYSLPLLCNTLQESYFLHYAAFVEAVFLLCGSSIHPEGISRAQSLLLYFVMTFSSLYGERYLTLNIHQLVHLPECVLQLGPLWAYSCFHFESANGDLTKLFHGTQNVELQILSSVNIIQSLPSLISTVPSQYSSVIQRLYPGRLTKHITHYHIQFLGKGYSKHLSDEVMQQLVISLEYEVPNLAFYSRVLLRGELYHSKEYSRVEKRNNFTIKYFCQERKLIKFGYIQCFCQHTGPVNKKSFALVFPTESNSSIVNEISIPNGLAICVPHIHRVKPTNKIDIVELNSIIGVCVNVSLSSANEDVTYICETPNRLETD